MVTDDPAAPRRGIFLDRDGVLLEMVDDAKQGLRPAWCLAEVRLCDGAQESVDRMVAAGFFVVVVTNQPDVGRGRISPEEADRINERLLTSLPGISSVEACYHSGRDACRCRKPEPGMLLVTATALGISLEASWMVGDRWVDILAGQRAGCRTALVETDDSWRPTSSGRAPSGLRPTFVGRNLAEVTELILATDSPTELSIDHPV